MKFNNEVLFSEAAPDVISKTDGSPKFIFARTGNTDLLIVKNRLHFYNGIPMQSIGDLIYTLKFCGVKKIISIDEVGHLDPRLDEGTYCFVHDHINLMGDNPLIGPNDNQLGVRFPDMSDCYNSGLLKKVKKTVIENKSVYSEGIYIGILGPAGETEAEARFYREIGGAIAGYSMVPENIAAVHAGIKFVGIGLISRHLLADKMAEETRSETLIIADRKSALKKANTQLNKILIELIQEL